MCDLKEVTPKEHKHQNTFTRILQLDLIYFCGGIVYLNYIPVVHIKFIHSYNAYVFCLLTILDHQILNKYIFMDMKKILFIEM